MEAYTMAQQLHDSANNFQEASKVFTFRCWKEVPRQDNPQQSDYHLVRLEERIVDWGAEPPSVCNEIHDLQPRVGALEAIEVRLEKVQELLELLAVGTLGQRKFYTTKEFALLVNRAEYTIRELCRLGRIKCTRDKAGRGGYGAYRISHEELLRFQDEGSLPDRSKH